LVALPLDDVTNEQLSNYLRTVLPEDAWEQLQAGKNIDRSLELPLAWANIDSV